MCVHHQSISLQSEDTVAAVYPDSDEIVVELLTQCELKLQLLHEELQGKDVAAIMKEMEEEEVSPHSPQQHSSSSSVVLSKGSVYG